MWTAMQWGPQLDAPPPMPTSGVGLWLLDPGSVIDLMVAQEWLDEAERRRAAAFATPALRRSFEIAHAATRAVLGARLRVEPGQVRLARHPCPLCGERHGRPFALSPGGEITEYSLSHTDGLVLIGVSEHPIGVDVEGVPERYDDLLSALHPRERATITALPDDARAVAFARTWARKEAYLKGIGTGLGREPHLDPIGADPGQARRYQNWTIHDVAVPQGYAAACAIGND